MRISKELKRVGSVVKGVSHSISKISQGAQGGPTGIQELLSEFPKSEKKAIADEYGVNVKYRWQCFFTNEGTLILYEGTGVDQMQTQFQTFVGTPEPAGLGTTFSRLRTVAKMLEDDEMRKTIDLLQPPIAKQGRPEKKKENKGCNTTFTNSKDASYIISRLKRDNPELAQQVIEGEISAHSAAIKAGIRKRYVSVLATPEGFKKKMNELFSEEEIDKICKR